MTGESDLPYNPTRLFRPTNSSFVYIFESTSHTSGEVRLSWLDLSRQIDSSALKTQDVGTPFDHSTKNATYAYIPVLSPDGSIEVIAGDCAQARGGDIWKFTPDDGIDVGNGSWTHIADDISSDGRRSAINFLADGMLFSTQDNASNPTTYLFGGMCPLSDASSSSWTSNATYSNTVVSLKQAATDQQYIATDMNTNAPPIAEAGFTTTALPRSNQPYTGLEQAFVLIGGHTQSAFINMSQVALFSLPQASWTFLPVQQPRSGASQSSTTDSVTTVEPRSGHTAVLSEDNSKIIVFGGWVGDINTPAQPQLAILDIGASYGGSGQWQWSVPSLSGSGLSNNASLYGHGAVMLSDGIMLIHGGFSISASSSMRKRATASLNSQSLLFNTSSNSWITTFDPSRSSNKSTASKQPATPTNDMAQKIGLAVGLTLGFLVLVALLAFYFWYSRRLKRRSMSDERNLMSRSSDGSFMPISQPFLEKTSIDGRGGDMTALNHHWMNVARPGSEMSQADGAATGMFVDIPSPTRGLRKGLSQRGYQYQAAPRYDDKRFSRGSGNIHPIAELEDEDINESRERLESARMSEAQRQLKEVEEILQANRGVSKNAEAPDPLRSHPVSPEIGYRPNPMLQADTSAFDGTLNEHVSQQDRPYQQGEVIAAGEPSTSGRLSPTKTDDRTSSNLSERSILSTPSITRTMSTRTGALLLAAATSHNQNAMINDSSSSSDARTSTMSTSGGRSSPTRIAGLARTSTNGSSAAASNVRNDADSWRTARSRLPTIPSEGDALLGSNLDRDDPYRRAVLANSPRQESGFASAQHSTQHGGRRRNGLLGSLKRAITAMSVDRTMSLASSRNGQDGEVVTSNQSSPTKERRRQLTDGMPRRTVSDGGALLHSKRGKGDWADNPFPPYHDDPDPGDWGEPTRSSMERQEAEEEWDVEDAAGKRDVQVMFTVPKSRLRVVNADMDRASLRSVSDGALSRSNSIRALQSQESRGLLRQRNEGDQRWKLDTMLEEQDKDKLM